MKQTDLGDCRRTVDLLPWYANNSLDTENNQHVQAHLDACAACRRELQFLEKLIPAMAERNVGGPPPFSQLLQRINRQERHVQKWKAAAAVVLTIAVATAVAVPVYLFQPRYQAVTNTQPQATSRVRMSVTFADRENRGTLTNLLEKYNADVLSGSDGTGTILLEFHLPPGKSVQQLQQQLRTEPQIREVLLLQDRDSTQ